MPYWEKISDFFQVNTACNYMEWKSPQKDNLPNEIASRFRHRILGSLLKICIIKATNKENIFFYHWSIGNTFSLMLLLFIAT